MIILITGASHTGKTALSQKLLEKYHYPYLSIDHLKLGLIRSGQTELTPMSKDCLLTEYLWPIVREMVKTAIENKQNLIVEGCYIPFDPMLARVSAVAVNSVTFFIGFSFQMLQNCYKQYHNTVLPSVTHAISGNKNGALPFCRICSLSTSQN